MKTKDINQLKESLLFEIRKIVKDEIINLRSNSKDDIYTDIIGSTFNIRFIDKHKVSNSINQYTKLENIQIEKLNEILNRLIEISK